MRNFYVTFDYKNNKMQLAVSSNAPAGTSIEATPDVAKIIWIVLAVVASISIVACIVGCYCLKRKDKKRRSIGGSACGKSRLLDS
jgi:hypothetical protein